MGARFQASSVIRINGSGRMAAPVSPIHCQNYDSPFRPAYRINAPNELSTPVEYRYKTSVSLSALNSIGSWRGET